MVIPFPVRTSAAAPPADDRLTVSLANLAAALEEQRIAVTAWRTVLRDLKSTTAGLHESLQAYSASLGNLGDNVSAVRDRALALERWADGVAAGHS